jgi:hypothetical protein
MATTSPATCCACGRPDALGLGLCPECGSANSRTDALVFVRRAAARADRFTTGDRIGAILGDRADTPDGREAVRGNRPVVRVPDAVAPLVVESLEQRGVPARAVPLRNAWTAMPPHFFLMLFSIAILGSMAGALRAPVMTWLSPLFATALLAVAHRSMSRPLMRSAVGEALPSDVERAVLDAFSRLGAGRPRELLADLVGIARPLLVSLRAQGDPVGLVTTLGDLIIVACATALETDHLLTTVAVVEHAIHDGEEASVEHDLRAAAARCAGAAEIGERRLVDAVATIADTGGLAASLDGNAGRRLVALTQELRTSASFRADALRDVDRLLASRSSD